MTDIIGTVLVNPRRTCGYIVYGVFDGAELIWCDSASNVGEIFDFHKLRRIPGFDEDKEYKVVIFEKCGNAREVTNIVHRIVNTYSPDKTPRFNKNIGRRIKKVVCLETGETFDTPYTLIKAKGINPNSLYPHLRGDKGHGSVGGLHYVYATNEIRATPAPTQRKTVIVDGVVYTVDDAAKIAKDIGYKTATTDDYTAPSDQEYIAKTLLTKNEYDKFLNEGFTRGLQNG